MAKVVIVSKKDKKFGKQTLLDVTGYPMNFPNKEIAKEFLKALNFKDKEINSFTFEEVEDYELGCNYHINNYEIRTTR